MRAAIQVATAAVSRVRITARIHCQVAMSPVIIPVGMMTGEIGGIIASRTPVLVIGDPVNIGVTTPRATKYERTPSIVTGITAVWTSSLRDTSEPAAAKS